MAWGEGGENCMLHFLLKLATAVFVKMNMFKCFLRSFKLTLLSSSTENFVQFTSCHVHPFGAAVLPLLCIQQIEMS